MNTYDVAFAVVGALERLQIEYALVGGMATVYYGYARTTDDVDLLIRVEDEQRLGELARELGPGSTLDPEPAFEVFTGKKYRQIHLPARTFRSMFFPLLPMNTIASSSSGDAGSGCWNTTCSCHRRKM